MGVRDSVLEQGSSLGWIWWREAQGNPVGNLETSWEWLVWTPLMDFDLVSNCYGKGSGLESLEWILMDCLEG